MKAYIMCMSACGCVHARRNRTWKTSKECGHLQKLCLKSSLVQWREMEKLGRARSNVICIVRRFNLPTALSATKQGITTILCNTSIINVVFCSIHSPLSLLPKGFPPFSTPNRSSSALTPMATPKYSLCLPSSLADLDNHSPLLETLSETPRHLPTSFGSFLPHWLLLLSLVFFIHKSLNQLFIEHLVHTRYCSRS